MRGPVDCATTPDGNENAIMVARNEAESLACSFTVESSCLVDADC
jgi:hypothetical protein